MTEKTGQTNRCSVTSLRAMQDTVCVHYAKGVPFGESTTQIQTAINTSAASYLKPPSQPTTTAKISSSTSTTTKTTTVRSSATTTASGSAPASTSGSSAETTTAAATTSKNGSSGNTKPVIDSPSTGSKAPVGAVVVLAGAGAAAWTMRRKEQ